MKNLLKIFPETHRNLVRNPQFVRIFIGLFISRTGNWFTTIAITYAIYEITHSALSVSIIWVVTLIPQIIFSPVLGIISDKIQDKIKFLVLFDIIRGLIVGLLFIFYRNTFIVYLIILANVSFGLLSYASYQSVFPKIVGKDNLFIANSYQNFSDNFSMIIGPLLAGIFTSKIGIKWAFIIDSFTFFISALSWFLVNFTSNIDQVYTIIKEEVNFFDSLRVGIKFLLGDKVLKIILTMGILSMFGFGAYSALMVVFAKDILNAGVAGYGLIYVGDNIGSIIGAIGLSLIAHKILNKGKFMSIGLGAIGITTILFALSNSLKIALLILIIEGIFVSLFQISEETILQLRIPENLRGRVFLVIGGLTNLSSVISMALAGIISDLIGVRSVFIISGIIAIFSSLIGLFRLKGI
ncbi:MAG: MFS transporter [candidate division WOR-3 bacterium]